MSGSAADVLVDVAYLSTLAAPFVWIAAYRLAAKRRWLAHRRLQVTLLTICWLSVLGLELRIRLAGGSGALIATATSHQTLARRLLGVHIVGALLTYVIWTGLAIASTRRFRSTLPGSFSRRHRQLGWCVLAGLVFTAATASGMYILTFARG